MQLLNSLYQRQFELCFSFNSDVKESLDLTQLEDLGFKKKKIN